MKTQAVLRADRIPPLGTGTGAYAHAPGLVRVALALVASLVGLALPAAAGAVTLGQLDPTPNDSQAVCGYSYSIYVEGGSLGEYGSPAYTPNTSLYTVPSGSWRITSWSVSQRAYADVVRLAVVSFASGAKSLTVDAFSAPHTISVSQAKGVVTFSSDIAVSGGQEIALDNDAGSGEGCAYYAGQPTTDQVDIADDGHEGTHDFGQNAYWSSALVNLTATLEPATAASPRRYGARRGDARVRHAILAADRAALHSRALAALKRVRHAHRRLQRRRLITVLRRLGGKLTAAAHRVAHVRASSASGRAGERDWIVAARTLARGLGQFGIALREAGLDRRHAAAAEIVRALRTIARAERLDLEADVELRLPRGA